MVWPALVLEDDTVSAETSVALKVWFEGSVPRRTVWEEESGVFQNYSGVSACYIIVQTWFIHLIW
jgi:hypothetical protein